MSWTLDYSTVEPVPEAVAAQILASAEIILQSRDWWVEPLSLEHRSSKQLAGSTRLWLGFYTLPGGRHQVIPEDEECLLVWADANFIVSRLADWSAEFKLAWRLEIDGNVVGEIADGKPSEQLKKFVDGFCSTTRLSPQRIPELLNKHAARKN
jgi:hypothetical protein